ncbi:hypothetical protein SUGI_1097620 [Cryptomeria japonica]|nr:hypothetical protein SUGI_1097620 [Cryptomeria japonica]
MAAYVLLVAEDYSRRHELQKPNAGKDNACSQSEAQTAALMRRLKEGISEFAEASTVKVVWGEKFARKEASLRNLFVEGIFSP